jgi:hypothetical protein
MSGVGLKKWFTAKEVATNWGKGFLRTGLLMPVHACTQQTPLYVGDLSLLYFWIVELMWR